MRLEIDDLRGEIINYSTLENYINTATEDNFKELKSLLTEIRLKLRENDTNNIELAKLANLIISRCNNLGIGIEFNRSKGFNKTLALHPTNTNTNIMQDRAGKVNSTLIIASILATAIMYTLLLLGFMIQNTK